jgi:cytochrome b
MRSDSDPAHADTDTDSAPVRIWDLPTRLFHWMLAAAVAASVVTAHVGGNAMEWHFRLGYLIFTLLAFRLLWGFVGGRWSRFVQFIYMPPTLLRYLRGGEVPGEHLDAGHNPLGSLSVFALLGLLLLQVGTGLVADDDIVNQGPLNKFVASATASQASTWHADIGQWILLALIGLHIAAIVYYRLRKSTDLVRPMLVGDKTLPADTPPATDSMATRLFALALLALCALGVRWVVYLGG